MIQLQRNETNGVNNQTLISGVTPVVPSELNFVVEDINSPEKVLTPVPIYPLSGTQPIDIFTNASSGGGKLSDGHYIATFTVPATASLGRSRITWLYKTAPSQPTYMQYIEEFEVLDYVSAYGSGGVPIVSYGEIRAFLRDRPENHVLVDGMLFPDSDIKMAMDQTVKLFNRILPPLGEYTSGNFPDAYLLTIGVASWLFGSEANRQLMEQLTYQDGNIHHGLDDKTQLYRAVADAYKTEFMALAKDVKMSLNINGIYKGDGLGVRFRYNRYVGGRVTL
jgi:hypothetical protein